MIISSAPKDEGWNFDLLLKTSESVMEMASIARINDANEEARIFYSHLASYCIRLRDFSVRARQTSSRINGRLVNQALVHLGSIVSESCLQQLPSNPATLEFHLGMLNLYWSEARKQSDEMRLEFTGRWLTPGEQPDEVDRALESCADELDKQLQDQVSKKWAEKFPFLDTVEPSYAICKAAQSIFDALLDCKGCSCPSQHEFGAKLELGTYRRPNKKPLVKSTRKRIRNPRGDDDVAGELDIDIFLSMERDWHEIRVQIVKELGGCFNLPGEVASPRVSSIKDGYARVERLCSPIIKTTNGLRSVLKLIGGQFFEKRFEKSNFMIDKTVIPISLSQCFEDRHDFFTEKTKRILSLIIGSTVLHLNGTSWLQPGWGSANIKFFQIDSRKTPLRPFIQIQLPKTSPAGVTDFQVVVDGGDIDDEISADLDLGHRCPVLVALAVVLIEVHFVKSFKKLAEMHDVPLIEVPSGRITLIDVDQVFNGDEEIGKEGWRSQIPEDSPLLMAIDNCLDGELWEDEEGGALDSGTLRSRIYQHVVRLLELHLIQGFSQIPLDGVDEYARHLDFGRWGQVITSQKLDNEAASLLSGGLTPARGSSSAVMLLAPSQVGVRPLKPQLGYQYSQLYPLVSSPSLDLDTMSNTDPEYRPSQFFDDEMRGRISCQPPANRTHFHVAIICALPREADAVTLLFDQFWDGERDIYGRADGDMNTYITGRIGDHNIVLALLPGMGTNNAAAATASLRSSYTSLRLAILVGICGGVPRIANLDVFLGDVVVSKTIIQYDYGKQYHGRFAVKNTVEDSLGSANRDIRGLLAVFETELMRKRLQKEASTYLKHLQATARVEQRRADYRYPGTIEDKLYPPAYAHKHRAWCDLCTTSDTFCESASKASCAVAGCGSTDLVVREHTVEEANFSPEIFIGRVGSGNTVMKSGEDRDRIASTHNIIAFETEGAGAWDEVPCIVVKGICDYADSHKDEAWQDFAAGTAAAVMKAILGRYIVRDGDHL
jgi:nucleoside phosphorylase